MRYQGLLVCPRPAGLPVLLDGDRFDAGSHAGGAEQAVEVISGVPLTVPLTSLTTAPYRRTRGLEQLYRFMFTEGSATIGKR